MSTRVIRAPKRPILRIRNRIDDTITNSVSTLTLHTTTDTETLVRTIIDLKIAVIALDLA